MKVSILGCGTSTGVPKIGNHWGQCDPDEPRNRRLRSSILVASNEQRVLVDCGPDLRQQLLEAEVERIDALIVTHDHGDHVHGIDELRVLAQALGRPVPLLARADTLASLQNRFAYAFASTDFYRAVVEPVEVGDRLRLGELEMRFVDQPHGDSSSLGIRFEDDGRSLGYAIDFHEMTGDMAALYEGVDVLICDCLTRTQHPTHNHLEGALRWASELKAGSLYLTHMGNGLDYRTLVAELPEWTAPAHDGLEIVL